MMSQGAVTSQDDSYDVTGGGERRGKSSMTEPGHEPTFPNSLSPSLHCHPSCRCPLTTPAPAAPLPLHPLICPPSPSHAPPRTPCCPSSLSPSPLPASSPYLAAPTVPPGEPVVPVAAVAEAVAPGKLLAVAPGVAALGAHQGQEVQTPQVDLQELGIVGINGPRRAPRPVPVARVQPAPGGGGGT